MTHLRDADFSAAERQLREELGARRVWIQYSNNKSRVRVCITVFYDGVAGYGMFFGDHMKDFSYSTLSSLVNVRRVPEAQVEF